MPITVVKARRDAPRDSLRLASPQVASAFRAADLVASLEISPGGHVAPRIRDWAAYWRPVSRLGSPSADEALRRLAVAWRKYIVSGFDLILAQEYCFRYFSLLNAVLSAVAEPAQPPGWQPALRTILGFECFGIVDGSVPSQLAVAGTTTIRNPSYLLAKLKWPKVPDGTKFLPLISLGADTANSFNRYRRLRLAQDPGISILAYLPDTSAGRSASLSLVNLLAKAVGSASDPYVEARAERIWTHALQPIIDTAHPDARGQLGVEFIDIGAGTGALTAALCHRVLDRVAAAGSSARFRLWFVDFLSAAPAQAFRSALLRNHVESALSLGNDYRAWLGQPRPLPRPLGLRIGLASKVFDMSSHFSACMFRTHVLESVIDGSLPKGGRFLPTCCLAPEGRGPEALMVSTSRIAVDEGHTWAQPSLSEYYRALQLASPGGETARREHDGLWLPVRLFDPASLVAKDGASVLSRLLEHCHYLIVVDEDLRPKDLLEHHRTFSPKNLVAEDVTSVMGLRGNYAYVLWTKDQSAPQLGGERVCEP
jgi:hypothetical protein